MPADLSASELLFVAVGIGLNMALVGGFIWVIYKTFRWTFSLYQRQHAFMDRAEAHFEAMERIQTRLLELAEAESGATDDPPETGGPVT